MGFDVSGESDGLVSLIVLNQKNAQEYWLGEHNFYVITRYNHSHMYAMAVYQLSKEIMGRWSSSQAIQ
jgi:membrane-bound lytic murein transglycosylase B